MATTKFYLDTRSARSDGMGLLKVVICKDSATRQISLGVYLLPEHWDAKAGAVVKRPDKVFINSCINKRRQEIDEIMLRLSYSGEMKHLDANALKKRIEYELTPEEERTPDETRLFAYNFRRFADRHGESTKGIYNMTYRHLQKFVGEGLDKLAFNDITKDWLAAFDNYLARTSPSRNARNIHLRNIRAVFNDAIDNEVTTHYPFRKFRIRNVATPKRSLTVEQLRQFFTMPLEDFQVQYRDMFMLIFYLCGINIIDLFNLKEITEGRVEYHRAKTGRLYSIKVEPEAMAIIEKYRGKTALLNIADRYGNHKDYRARMNKTLQHVGEYKRVGRGGKKVYSPLYPHITTYWARHTWATIAAGLDIPKETIAAALGHGGNTVTDIYIDFDFKKVDEANRKVIDFVNGGNYRE